MGYLRKASNTSHLQQNLQLIAWVTEDDEARPVGHFQESSREVLLELPQVRYRSRVHIPLVPVDELAVGNSRRRPRAEWYPSSRQSALENCQAGRV